jgi:stage II sporulation protein M
LLLVTFTTIFSIPFIHSFIRIAEVDSMGEDKKSRLFAEYSRALFALLFLFLGFLVAFSFWYIILPQDWVVTNFHSQIEKFCAVNGESMQQCLSQYGISSEGITAHVVSGMQDVYLIFMNNLYVLFFTLVFSLTFGAGAIFVLAWNASVISVAIGMMARTNFAEFYMPFLMYMFHGIPEIAAYLVIALAGGILSTALIRRDLRRGNFKIAVNVAILFAISVLLLLVAALIEVYITPVLFG